MAVILAVTVSWVISLRSVAWTSTLIPTNFFLSASLEEAVNILSLILAVSGAQTTKRIFERLPSFPKVYSKSKIAYLHSFAGRLATNSLKVAEFGAVLSTTMAVSFEFLL